MLADDKGVDIAGVYIEFFAKQILDPPRIQDRSDSHDPALGDLDEFQGGVGQDIDRIGDDQEDGLCIPLCDLRNDGFQHIDVFTDKIHAGIRLEHGLARRQDDDAGVRQILVSARIDLHRLCKRSPVGEVQRDAVCPARQRIDQYHF